MWILPKNLSLDTLASAQDTKVSDLDSEQFSQICAKSLTWRGKDSLSRTWLQRWKRVSWMQHLFLRTLRPSLTDAFVDAWTSSLAASPANHLAPLESEQLPKTPGTCSPASPEGSENASQELFSSKTWKEFCPAPQEMVNPFSSMSLELWKKWVIGQRQAYSARKKLAHRTGGSGSSSWATPTAFDSGGNLVRTPEKLVQTRVETNAGCMNLREQVHYPEMDHSLKAAKNWPTVTVGEEKYRIKGNSQASKCLSAMAVRGELGQPDQASSSTKGKSQESWPTPLEDDSSNVNPSLKRRGGLVAKVLKNNGPHDQASSSTKGKSQGSWPTPTAAAKGTTAKTSGRHFSKSTNLALQVAIKEGQINPKTGNLIKEAVPIAGQHDQASSSTNGKSQESWSTPNTFAFQPPENTEAWTKRAKYQREENGVNLHRPIQSQVLHENEKDFGPIPPIQSKLNPAWVEQLMGLPTGWTDCDYSATGLSRPQQP